MKSFVVVTGAILLVLSAAQGMAACPSNPLTNAGIKTALAGATGASKYHCAIRVSGPVTEKWNESLGATNTGNNAVNGNITDYKNGPAAPGNIDPTKVVGTWSIDNSRIIYNYGSGGIFIYSVTGTGPYVMCNVSTEELITVNVSTSPTSNPTSCP